MDDLFDLVSDDTRKFNELLDSVRVSAVEVAAELGHKDGTLRVEENVTKNEINYPISIAESPNVFGKDNSGSNVTLTPVVTLFKTSERSHNPHCVELRLGLSNVSKFEIPEGSVIKEKFSKDDETKEKKLSGYSIFVSLDCADLGARLRGLLTKVLSAYCSSVQPVFGCCDKYLECSNAGKCIHPNKLYASACTYRQRLAEGKIFYGEKRNV